MVPSGDISLGVAENQVEQACGPLPDCPRVCLVGAVEVHRKQDTVIGIAAALDDSHPQRADDADALHRVGDRTKRSVFVQPLPASMQLLEKRLNPALVGHSVQARHEAGSYRCHDQQLGRRCKARCSDFKFRLHGVPS